MTPNELQILICGIAIGANLMVILNACWDWRNTRRGIERSRQARRRAAADHYLNTLRLYRLQNRSRPMPTIVESTPHPAELLEASVRDFELNLYDTLDRVEDATRRDGLL
ncbi:hypothetical protein [Streptomyces sp. A012304]|uniref:hypothetical protein n=1 Tax=Streptomyces sp. A012304 TaxID=375446 RepID=UPI00222E2E69|nr:hypothetical protein [Streptomyces sp. A012304]GKQ35816.1 hypothetical protein ALMP_23590 [Streptomyces sp. A012304]